MTNTVLITGVSKGIGLALAKQFLANNYKVIGACRSGRIENFTHPSLEVFQLDLENVEGVAEAAKKIVDKHPKIDLLINNAGIGPDLDFTLPEEESFQQTFNVNVTGTVFFTESLLGAISKEGKIITISSKMGSIEVCQLSDSVAYRMSKTALNMYTKILVNRLNGNPKVASVHPGWVRTTISKSNVNGRLSSEESAAKIYDFAISNFKNGIFWNIETQAELPW